jgi:hypothetical protein
MKGGLWVLLIWLFTLQSFLFASGGADVKIEEIRTTGGKVYTGCTVKRADLQTVMVIHSSGVATIPAVELSQDVRDLVGVTAMEARQRQIEADKAKQKAENKLKITEESERLFQDGSRRNARMNELTRNAISAAQLREAYDENELAVERRYKGKRLDLWGYVLFVGRDIRGQAAITLSSERGGGGGNVICYFKNRAYDSKIATLRKSDAVRVNGEYSGTLLLILQDCKLTGVVDSRSED